MTTITSDVVTVTVQGITGEIDAKIDTGAHQTSMHADEIEISGENVVFKLNGRVYRAPLETEQDVSSSDGGTQSRPVIRSTIEIAGQSVETLINLNDRGEMPQKILIGQDVIRGAGLTLQLSPDAQEGDVQEGDAEPGAEPVPTGTPEIYKPMDGAATVAPAGGVADVELSKKVLKLMADLNAVQRDLMEVIQLINNKGSQPNG